MVIALVDLNLIQVEQNDAGLTSELWGEEQSLEQRVEVAGTPLVLDAAQIASPTWRRWLVSPLCNSVPGGSRGANFLLLFLEKIPKHAS